MAQRKFLRPIGEFLRPQGAPYLFLMPLKAAVSQMGAKSAAPPEGEGNPTEGGVSRVTKNYLFEEGDGNKKGTLNSKLYYNLLSLSIWKCCVSNSSKIAP